VAVGDAVGNNTNLTLSWRYQGAKYSNDRNPSSRFSNEYNGIELGKKLLF
jgi:hypothetical protein